MNKAGTFVAKDGTVYVDRKRYLWLFSLLLPCIAVTGPLLYIASNREYLLWLFFLSTYITFPLMDYLLGEDKSSPPTSVIDLLEADMYYRRIARLNVPVIIAAFIFCAWFVASYPLSLSGYLAVALLAGNIGGYGINIGHELGHKRNKLDTWLAKIVLAPAAYGHFLIEHNRGHHKHVATPQDTASAQMGESIYRFALRELPGAISRAWSIEKRRLGKAGKPVWSPENEYLQAMFMTLAFFTVLVVWLGLAVVPYLGICACCSMWQLTSANYIEHYGLLRQKLPEGRYEQIQPHHSWNSDHIFSNWALFHLQRHSDHHANATRSYQALRHFEGLPTLPSGYFGMYTLAYLPWLWFKVMDKRLLQVTGGDISKINILAQKRKKLIKKYQLAYQALI
ncbi:alkane 1-monooxygenase [Thalassomonas viridans]|uniref:Alkane 1-monooxygenase n=1 Tax=Thalassomonas viridans TaxID=137584 RepID=A0AAF0CE44_9GAMM|nr:alkane 1-monooxygenase [Thalassomonas viridans]WDE08534.1 alkane 1-monooxygenase [Thalassomonas viridans]